MANLEAVKKQLKIKSGVVQRLAKENKLYTKEVGDLITKQDGLKAKGAEEWDIKNAGKMIEESRKMVKDTATRLEQAAGGLEQLITEAKTIDQATELEEFTKAEQILAEARA